MSGPRTQPPTSNLFQGARFWLSQNIPQRTRLKEMISENGGHVVLFEKYADVKLVDHTRKNLPPDAFSYQYIERSVRNGRLEDLEAHRVGPSAPRPMGASHIPKKGTRTDYSLQEDQILYDYLYPYEQEESTPIGGNRIYKDLAQKFPQHSWQSWRSRYLKILRGKPRPGGGVPRPDLVHGTREAPTTPQPALQHQKEPVAESDALQDMPPRHASSANPKLKRKRVPGTRSSARLLEAAASPPSSKRRMIEAPRSAGPLAPEARAEGSEPLSRPPEPAKPLQPPRHTQDPSSAPTRFAPRSKESVSAQGARAESTNGGQDAVDPIFLEMPFLPSSPEPDHGEELGEGEFPDVDAWIDSQLERGNVDEPTIISVLRSANMDQELAGEVLGHWDPEKGIPGDMPGIWTAEDDKCLEGQDARGIQRVLTKHGQDASNSRWEYLRMARERGML